MSDDFSKFTGPRPDDELHQGLEVPATFSIDPTDRMPVPAPTANDDRPPPLAVDTFVCMEDKRSFVIRNSDGSIWLSFEPSEVQRLPNGGYYVELGPFKAAFKRSYDARYGFRPQIDAHDRLEDDVKFKTVIVRRMALPRVEPIRPACTHYVRMQTDISADRDRRYLARSCSAQRSETGEYYSVGDAAIYACSLRNPRHLETEALMDAIDERDALNALNKQRAAAFDVDAELARENESSPGALGVLGNKG